MGKGEVWQVGAIGPPPAPTTMPEGGSAQAFGCRPCVWEWEFDFHRMVLCQNKQPSSWPARTDVTGNLPRRKRGNSYAKKFTLSGKGRTESDPRNRPLPLDYPRHDGRELSFHRPGKARRPSRPGTGPSGIIREDIAARTSSLPCDGPAPPCGLYAAKGDRVFRRTRFPGMPGWSLERNRRRNDQPRLKRRHERGREHLRNAEDRARTGSYQVGLPLLASTPLPIPSSLTRYQTHESRPAWKTHAKFMGRRYQKTPYPY